MSPATELDQLTSHIFSWQNYDARVKADLFSTALLTPGGIYLIDPIPLRQPAFDDLTEKGRIGGIFVTNENHFRHSASFAETFSVPVQMHHEMAGSPEFPSAVKVRDGEVIFPNLQAIAIAGAPRGEMALYWAGDGGTIILGDALIHSDPYGFALLPAKYCQDQKTMRKSLQKLLAFSFDRILFAHGTPIVTLARTRLEKLLTSEDKFG